MGNNHYTIKVEIFFEIGSDKIDRNEAIDKVQELLRDVYGANIQLIQIVSTPDLKKSLTIL